MAVGRRHFYKLKIPPPVLGFEPQTLVLGQNCTTRPTWQVSLKGIKVCAQRSMSNYLQFGSGQ